MTREILTNNAQQPVLPKADEVATPAQAPSAASPSKPTARDALAGAFPDWDLLPATQFVRRVK